MRIKANKDGYDMLKQILNSEIRESDMKGKTKLGHKWGSHNQERLNELESS